METKDKIKLLHRCGTSNVEIAKIFNVSRQYVHSVVSSVEHITGEHALKYLHDHINKIVSKTELIDHLKNEFGMNYEDAYTELDCIKDISNIAIIYRDGRLWYRMSSWDESFDTLNQKALEDWEQDSELYNSDGTRKQSLDN